jgi:hypothetical protein
MRESIKKGLNKNWKIVKVINKVLSLINKEMCINCFKIETAGLDNNICSKCWEKHQSALAECVEKENWHSVKTPCGCTLFDCDECGNAQICSQ